MWSFRSWTTTPSMLRGSPSQSRAMRRVLGRFYYPGCRGPWQRSGVGGVRSYGCSSSQDGSDLDFSASSREIWLLGASLVPEFGPQAAGRQPENRTSGWILPGKLCSFAAAGQCRSLTSVCQHSRNIISLWCQGLISEFCIERPSGSQFFNGFKTTRSACGPLGKMSLPIGMCRRAFSYDDALDDPAPMTPPPSDMGGIPWKPVIPERKYQHLAKVEEGEASGSPNAATPSAATDSADKVPVVKAKATHVIMNSLITKQTQESIQRFEQQAGLRDAGYTPHKGLTTEETKYLRVAEALHKLKLQSGERTKEEQQPASSQSTPSSTPHSSPKQKSRGWFPSGPSAALPGSNLSTMDPGSGNDGNSSDKWSFFGPRPLQKSDSGGFTIQTYKGAQKPSPMELMRAQASRMAEDPAILKPPKMDIPVVEGKKPAPRTHNLKPRDLNVLTPTGF